MITKPTQLYKILEFILIYSFYKFDGVNGFYLNQESIAEYFHVSRRSVITYIKKAREEKLIEIVGKQYIYTDKPNHWLSNLYIVHSERLNGYIKENTGKDVLNDLKKCSDTYFGYMKFVKERKISELPIEEQIKIEEKIKKTRKREEKKVKTLIKQNKYYIDLLKEVNNDTFPMYYLEDNRRRLTNSLCATHNMGHKEDNTRKKALTKYFGTDQIIEYDTNGSIYRLSYSIGNRDCADFDIDIYRKIFDECHFEGVRWTKSFRDTFKNALMPIYMRESSIKYKALEYENQKIWNFPIDISAKKTYKIYDTLTDTINMPLFDILNTIKNAMHKVLNMEKFFKADIFIYESNLHILMLKKFKEMGINTINVYDGFYFIKDEMSQELYNQVYKEATEKLLKDIRV